MTDYTHPTEAFLRSIDIHTLLPQQEPFVMIGTLTMFSERAIATETTVTADNLFVEDGQFQTPGLIENIAQTCAARIGYANVYIYKKGVQIGYIGGIRNLTVHQLPHVGDVLTTRVEVLEDIFGMTLARATEHCGDTLLVETQMKIAVKEQEGGTAA